MGPLCRVNCVQVWVQLGILLGVTGTHGAKAMETPRATQRSHRSTPGPDFEKISAGKA